MEAFLGTGVTLNLKTCGWSMWVLQKMKEIGRSPSFMAVGKLKALKLDLKKVKFQCFQTYRNAKTAPMG